MKAKILMAFAALSFAACNNAADDKTDTTVVTTEDAATTTAADPTSYTPVDGDVKYSGSKVMVMKNGAWVEANEDVKLDDGVVVYRNGRAERDGVEVELREGEIVNRTGRFFDNTGKAIDNAWEVTKEGTKDAGRAVKKAANKVGEKVEDVLDGNDNKRNN